MKKLIIIILLLFILIAPLLTGFENSDPIVDAINNVRASYGLTPVQHKTNIDDFAMYRLNANGFDPQHKNILGDFGKHFKADIPGYYMVGEIIAQGKKLDINKILQAWLESPTHKKVLLNGYTFVGYAEKCSDGYYIIYVIFINKVR